MIGSEPAGRVLIAGGSSPIGREIGRELAARGHAVALHYRSNAESARATVAAFERAERHAALGADLLQDRQAEALVEAAVRGLGGELTGVINCAWPGHGSEPLASAPASAVEAALDGLRTHLSLSRAALPSLRATRGSMVFLGAGLVHRRHPGLGLYALGKAAAESASLTMALEEGPHGVRVNVIAPGRVAIGPDLTDEDPAFAALEVIGAQRRVLPLPSPAEIAQVVAFLIGSESSALTGQVLAVSGGEQW